jgi:hypothetical protein
MELFMAAVMDPGEQQPEIPCLASAWSARVFELGGDVCVRIAVALLSTRARNHPFGDLCVTQAVLRRARQWLEAKTPPPRLKGGEIGRIILRLGEGGQLESPLDEVLDEAAFECSLDLSDVPGREVEVAAMMLLALLRGVTSEDDDHSRAAFVELVSTLLPGNPWEQFRHAACGEAIEALAEIESATD